MLRLKIAYGRSVRWGYDVTLDPIDYERFIESEAQHQNTAEDVRVVLAALADAGLLVDSWCECGRWRDGTTVCPVHFTAREPAITCHRCETPIVQCQCNDEEHWVPAYGRAHPRCRSKYCPTEHGDAPRHHSPAASPSRKDVTP
jgi:hypothetical protein